MKLGKEENRKTKTRIEQCIWAHEKREVTRRGAGKDETGKGENWETERRIGPLTSYLGFASVSPFGEN